MKMMVAAVAAAVTLGIGSYALAHHEKGHEGGGGGGGAETVTICHFPGHDGDFQTSKIGCDTKAGGIEIEIACTAAQNGHGVIKLLCGGGK
jgi:hypothetical protein